MEILELFVGFLLVAFCIAGMFGVFCLILYLALGRSLIKDWKQSRLRKKKGIPDWVQETTLLAMEQEGRSLSFDERLADDFAAYSLKRIPADAELFLVFFWEDNRRSNSWERDIDFFIFTRLPLEDDVYELLNQYLELHPNVDETKVLFTVRSARDFDNPKCYRMSYIMDDEY